MTPLRARAWAVPVPRSLLASGVLLMLAAAAQAQVSPDAVEPRPSIWVEPRVTAGVTLSNRGNGSGGTSDSEQLLEAGPGVRAVMNTPRVQGFVDYSLSAQHRVQGTSGDELRHALQAAATVNAWDNRAFVDISGVVADASVSAFGTPAGSSLSDANRAQSANFRLSPYLRGDLGSVANYELRYSLQTSDTDAINRSDVTVQDIALRLNSRRTGQRLGWSLDASSQHVDYSLGRQSRSDSVVAGLLVSVTPQLLVTLRAGAESNDVITLNKESYSTGGVSVEWRPSSRTRLMASADDRYFGTGHNIAFEHRTGRTVWRYTDTRGVTNNPLEAASASLGTVYDMFDSMYASLEPDPVRRAQLVLAQLQLLGLQPNTQIFQSFLASSSTLEREQRLSVALSGVRSVVTFALGRSSIRRLGPATQLGDDFDLNADVRLQSWYVDYAHRLTPLTSYNLSLTGQRSDGSAGLSQRVTSFAVGMSTRLAVRTDGMLRLQRSNHRNVTGSYGETQLAGFVTHRF